MDPLRGRVAGLTPQYCHRHSLWRSLDSLLQLPTEGFLEMIKGSAMVNPMGLCGIVDSSRCAFDVQRSRHQRIELESAQVDV
jgi:hypothetical protein